MRSFVLPRNETFVFRWLRRFTIAVVCVHAVVSCWSMYRRIWQVQRIRVIATSTMLRPSVTAGYDVITSGEVHNLIRLELVQGDNRAVLHEQLSDRNHMSAYDVRLFHYIYRDTLAQALISRFHPGPAVLRLTVFGGRKLLRIPAPWVRELHVQIE